MPKATSIYETIDSRFRPLTHGDVRLRQLYGDCRWAEGPAYFPAGRYLTWSDIPNDRILRWDETSGEVSVFLNRFDGYIYEEATGAEEDGQPVFAFVQRDAKLYGAEAEVATDGSWEVVVAKEDPGRPNWLSTADHPRGLIWFRWFLAEHVPTRPDTEVVPVASLRT